MSRHKNKHKTERTHKKSKITLILVIANLLLAAYFVNEMNFLDLMEYQKRNYEVAARINHISIIYFIIIGLEAVYFLFARYIEKRKGLWFLGLELIALFTVTILNYFRIVGHEIWLIVVVVLFILGAFWAIKTAKQHGKEK